MRVKLRAVAQAVLLCGLGLGASACSGRGGRGGAGDAASTARLDREAGIGEAGTAAHGIEGTASATAGDVQAQVIDAADDAAAEEDKDLQASRRAQFGPSHLLPELVPEGRPSLSGVYNPAAVDIVAIGADGQVSCGPKRPPPPAAPGSPACRDPRLAFRWTDGVRHDYQDAVHQISGTLGEASVALWVGERVARLWSVSGAEEPRGCGFNNIVRRQTYLTIDVTCAGDVAVVRWVIWRGFLQRECEDAGRPTRAIGPDLRCPMPRDDPHADVVDSGIDRVDLRTGRSEPLGPAIEVPTGGARMTYPGRTPTTATATGRRACRIGRDLFVGAELQVLGQGGRSGDEPHLVLRLLQPEASKEHANGLDLPVAFDDRRDEQPPHAANRRRRAGGAGGARGVSSACVGAPETRPRQGGRA
jgi:hypothetical protein